jgi:hypothetical protein
MQRISIHKMIEPYMYVMLVTLISIESVLDRFIDKRESLTNLSDLHCSSRPPRSLLLRLLVLSYHRAR